MTVEAIIMPLVWVVIAFVILLFLQRWIHTHLHGVSMLITRRPEWAVILYSIILLPGVFLHELSHWLTANLLGVRTGSFSVIPKRQADGSIVLGYVEYYKGRNLGPFRESLIGGAPLIAGTGAILLIGFLIFDVSDLTAAFQTGEIDMLSAALAEVFAINDILVWLYLRFAFSNAMMPSPADRRAWPAFLLLVTVATILLSLLGVTETVVAGLVQPATTVFGYMGIALSMAIAVDVLFVVLIAIIEWIVSRIRGVSVVYGAEPPPGSKKVTL